MVLVLLGHKNWEHGEVGYSTGIDLESKGDEL